MDGFKSTMRDVAEDLFFGQLVIMVARWFLIASGLVLVLWTADDATRLVVGVLPLGGLMGLNFYLHGRYLTERPANQALLLATGVLDLAIVTAALGMGPEPRGLDSPFFVLYYPVVAAVAFVLPQRLAAVYTMLTIGSYATACLLIDPLILTSSVELERLAQRLTVLAAVAGLASYYWRFQRARRRAAPDVAVVMRDVPA